MSDRPEPEPPLPADSTAAPSGRLIRRGLVFTGGADGLRYVFEFATSLILARILVPEDYGPITVVSSLVQLSWVVGNLGMAGAIIQTAELSRTETDTAWTVSALMAAVLTAMYGVLAIPVSRTFDMPVLAQLMPIMSSVVLLAGLSSVPQALLRRRLQFGRLGLVNTTAAIVSAAVGITLAVNGYGVWSLCWAPVASGLWILTFTTLASRYLPKPSWNRSALSRFLRFGGGLTAKNGFLYLSRNMDNLIIARTLGERPTGLYNSAYNLSRTPQSRLMTVLYQVCFPAFCRVRNDLQKFHQWYLLATTAVALAITPFLLGLAVVAFDAIGLILGMKWVEMVPTLQLLCVGSLIGCLCALGGTAIEATGRLRYEVFTHGVDAFLVISLVAILVRFGIEGAAWGIVARSLVLFALKTVSVQIVLDLNWRRQVAALTPSLVAGLAMVLVVVAIQRFWPGFDAASQPTPNVFVPWRWHFGEVSVGRLVASVVAGAVVYFLLLFLVARDQLMLVKEQARGFLPGRSIAAAPQAEPEKSLSPDGGTV